MAKIKNDAISEKGHQVTGQVAILYGTVKAVSPDGTVRMLKINSPVFADDRIVTGDDGSVSIVFNTFPPTQLDLGRVSDVVIDEDVYGAVSPEVVAEASVEKDAIQKALLAGDQPLELDPTAAGVEDNAGGGHSVFVVNPDWVHVTPESGAETSGITWDFAETEKYVANQDDNSIPAITVDPGNGGSGIVGDGADVVYESGLPAGSNASANTEYAYGTFTISDPDGLADIQSVTINGIVIPIGKLVGTEIIGTSGTLTVTSYDSTTGVANYTYELKTPTTDLPGPETEVFILTVSDGSTTSTPATITIEITDDIPTAIIDSNGILEDTTTAITGDVLTNDQSGADTPATFVSWNSTTANYGTFTDPGDDGTYNYVLDNSNPLVQALDAGETLTETFTYTMRDADGDTSSTTLTITITGTNDGPKITTDPGNIDGTPDTVYESGLAIGSHAAVDTEFASGTFTVSDPDGLDDIQSVTINGIIIPVGSLEGTVINGASGDMTITDYTNGVATYTYELKTPTTDIAGPETDVFTLTVSDGTADSTPATITINIADDLPAAAADGPFTVTEDGAVQSVSGTVLANDIYGADGAAAAGAIVWDANTAAKDTLDDYGTLILNADGSYSFVLDNSSAAVQALEEGAQISAGLGYTIKDADGDTSHAAMTINIVGTNDGPKITTDPGNIDGTPDTVYESGLAIGSNAAVDTEFASGTFTVSDPDGLDDIQSVTINGIIIPVGSLEGTVINGTNGDMTITDYTNGVATYTYELKTPTTDIAGPETDVFTLTVSDGTADSTPATITINIADDLPAAYPNTNAAVEGAVVQGNVLTDGTDDVFGADGPVVAGGGVVGVKAGSDITTPVTTGVGTVINGLYGKLTLSTDGSYTYDGNPDAIASAKSDVFVYTIKDGDGDFSTTTLTINLTDSGLLAPADNDAIVYEKALDTNMDGSDLAASTYTGSIPGNAGETDAINQLNATGGVGPYTYELVGSASGSYGTIQINTDGSYIYTLTKPYDTTPDANNGMNTEENKESFTYKVTDGNGNTALGTITVDIVDDIPTANSAEYLVEAQPLATTAQISNIAAGWISPFDSNVDTKTSTDADPYYEKIAWGDDTNKSSYVYNDNAVLANVNIGEKFTLGTFTHNNFPIPSGSSITTANLKVTFDVVINGQIVHVDHTIQFQHNETPNDGANPDDIVTIINGTNVVNITVGEAMYQLTIGFQDANGNTVNQVYTDENASTSFNLNGTLMLSSVDSTPDVVGTIDANFGADGPGAMSVVAIAHDVNGDGTAEVYNTSSAGYNAATNTLTIATHEGGTFTMNFLTGDYTYTAPASPTDGTNEVIAYTVVDADGDTATAELTMKLTVPDMPVAPADNDAIVYEKALDTNMDGSDLAASTYTGSIPGDAGETDAINQLNATGGTGPYTYELVGSAAGSYGTIQINPDGSYIYTLTKPYDTTPDANNGMNTEENKESFTYKVTDGNGNTALGTITVDIVDDIPTAGDQSVTVGEGTSLGTNLLLIIDNSGSMADPSGVNGLTRLALAKDALETLINEYEGHGDVMVRLVTFNSTSQIVGSEWMTADAAITAINALTAGGRTNYDAALNSARDAFDDDGAIAGGQNISYFLSDGAPNEPSGSAGINSSEQNTWEGFLEANDITSFALGMGTGVTSSNLAPIAYDGLNEVQINPIVVTDLAQLGDVLLDTVIIPSALEGNLVTGSVPASFGADGPAVLKIVSIAHDANGDGTDEIYNTSSAGYNSSTTTLTITTEAGGTFAVNFSTGAYTYTGPASPTLAASDVFKYTIMDGDGDTATANLTVNLPVEGTLVVGTNADDNTSQTIDHYIDDAAPYAGAIMGTGGNDVLVGDLNATSIAGKTLNLSLILDTSGSMDDYTIQFNGQTMTRIAALEASVEKMLNDLANGPAEHVRVQIVTFGSTANVKGVYDLKVPSELAAALAAINNLQADGGTNYEAGLQKALAWANSTGDDAPLTGDNVISQAIFVSDGEPTQYYVGDGTTEVAGLGNQFDQTALNHILNVSGDSDTVSEVQALEAKGFTIEAVGINVTSTNLDHLNQVEGEAANVNPDVATNITTGEQLSSVLVNLTSTVVSTAGDDNIVGGDGDDVIFGDTINYNYTGTESEMIAYIKANHLTLSAESGMTGGDDIINAGAGNDIVYGQEGNDVIYGGEGNDILSGGTGNNILSGGTGADTFTLTAKANDTIKDYSKTQGDKVDISSVLDIADETTAKTYMEFHNNANGKAVLEVYNSTTHSAGNLVGSITFDNISDANSLDSLLGKVDVDHDS